MPGMCGLRAAGRPSVTSQTPHQALVDKQYRTYKRRMIRTKVQQSESKENHLSLIPAAALKSRWCQRHGFMAWVHPSATGRRMASRGAPGWRIHGTVAARIMSHRPWSSFASMQMCRTGTTARGPGLPGWRFEPRSRATYYWAVLRCPTICREMTSTDWDRAPGVLLLASTSTIHNNVRSTKQHIFDSRGCPDPAGDETSRTGGRRSTATTMRNLMGHG